MTPQIEEKKQTLEKDINAPIVVKLDVEEQLCKSNSSIGHGQYQATLRGIINQILLTSTVLLTAAACGMPIGYSAVVLPQLYNSSDSLSIDLDMGSWIASVHSAATPFGSFASGPLMDRYGRRPALLFAILPLFGGWIFIATATSHFLLLFGRIVAGIAVGIIAAPAQVLIAETVDPKLRGTLISAPFVSYSLGILLVYALGSDLHWRVVAWCGTILPVVSFISIFIAYESPIWLARNNKKEQAIKALKWLQGSESRAKKDLNELEERFKNEKLMNELSKERNEGFLQMIKQKAILKPLIIINTFNTLLTLSGTYLIVFYAADIIKEISEDVNAMHAAVMTAVLRLIFTVIYCFVLHIMKRRKMIISCGIGSGISACTLAIYKYIRYGSEKSEIDMYINAICILFYLATNTGLMAMPGCMVGELLPTRIRGKFAGYIFAFFNFTLFCTAKVFPFFQYTFKTEGIFLVFGVSSFALSIAMYFLLPETKGKSLGEIEDYFSGKTKRTDSEKI